MGRVRIGVLSSGRGSNFQSIAEAIRKGGIDAEIAVLVCNVPGAGAIDRARDLGVPCVVIDHTSYGKDREAFERAGSTPPGKCISTCTSGLNPSRPSSGSGDTC